jgi:predicted flap endonuclease-1-like 5' DNA nuclease
MSPIFTFVLGLLIGWLIEWLIDFFYWRRRYGERDRVPASEPASVGRTPSLETQPARIATPINPDDLKVIKGVGPVIERKLNEAGIYTFEKLGNLTVAQLRRILGNVIERLSDEEALLQQARDLARRK